MASIDLLEELKLTEYYPQKLSFSEAIKLRGDSLDGFPKKYCIEIVRKLLTLDSTTAVSLTTEINERLVSADNTETDTKNQCAAGEVRPSRKRSVKPPTAKGKTAQKQRKLHPMDLLVVVMNCCDDFLRQVLVEKMFVNKLSFPVLLPSVRNGSYTLLLLALRSLVPEVEVETRENSASLTDTLVDVKCPVVSFIRIGDLKRSKSKLVNDLLNTNSFNTFFHRECPNGSARRTVSNGCIEAAWFQSSTASEEEFNCRFFTALNLRGNAKDYPRQTQFLCQSSTLVVIMVDAIVSFKELYDNVLKNVEASKPKIIVCYISPGPSSEVDNTYIKFLEELMKNGVIFEVIYDYNDEGSMSDDSLMNNLRQSISELFKEQESSFKKPTYVNICGTGQKFGFSLDECKSEYELGKSCADKFVGLVLKASSDCKPILLPLQGDPWNKIGKLEREQRQTHQDNMNREEYFIAEKEGEKRQQREIQCRNLIQLNEAVLQFSLNFCGLQDSNILYYMNFCRTKLDARSRHITSNTLEEYTKEKEKHRQLQEKESDVKLRETELKIASSTIGLEHILRELGQMYEAVILQGSRMKEELRNARLAPVCIEKFPSIVAELLLKGLPLELMDGDASNVPITWLNEVLTHIKEAVLNHLAALNKQVKTENAKAEDAKIFVMAIIGIQSSGKSTLLNALFGLQFPVSAGRCTKGIYCHLVPVDKESLNVEYDYVLVVDTEGLGSSQFTGDSTFRDNELATFAIGLADATIINMKGENWSEMKDILQIVAHGLIRIRKTKSELKLMPRCMFVHQNVPAVDAETRNRLGQEKQLKLLDTAVETAARKEGFTDITRFDQVITLDPGSYSWYFPDLWNGRPPKARVSQDYIKKTNELRQHLLQVMNDNPSKLTITGFSLRVSDLWNAMLHNDFVLCFRNTQDIISGTVLNDRISHEVDHLKSLNNLERAKFRLKIYSFKCVEKLMAEQKVLLEDVSDAIEKNFATVMSTLQEIIVATDINAALKQRNVKVLNGIKEEERQRMKHVVANDMHVHKKKLEIGNDDSVKRLLTDLNYLENLFEHVDKRNEAAMKEFNKSWHQLIDKKESFVKGRLNEVESEIGKTMFALSKMLDRNDALHLEATEWSKLFVDEMPQVTENDIAQKIGISLGFGSAISPLETANNIFQTAREKWELQFQNQRGLEFNAYQLQEFLLDVGQLLGISVEENQRVYKRTDQLCSGPELNQSNLKQTSSRLGWVFGLLKKAQGFGFDCDELPSSLPQGYRFKSAFIVKFIKYVCHYTYNRSVENSKIFISMTDPLTEIDKFQVMTAEEVSKLIFEHAQKSFVKQLGDLIKAEVCKSDQTNRTFMSKSDFLRAILTDLGQKTFQLTEESEKKLEIVKRFMLKVDCVESFDPSIFLKFLVKQTSQWALQFKQTMLYIELGKSTESEIFFLDIILKVLKEMLTNKNASESDFQKLIKNYVGTFVEKAKRALIAAETNCKGCSREYVRIFKEKSETDHVLFFSIDSVDGFTEEVAKQIDSLYADFLSQANSSFETLVCEDNRAALKTVFEKIMGCPEKCPFCSAPCSQSLPNHAGDHRANHYPIGVSGTVEIQAESTKMHETYDATKERKGKNEQLSVDTCQTMIDKKGDIRTLATMKKYNRFYHRWFGWNYHSLESYKEIAGYEKWDIPSSKDHNASLYWKWFMAQFAEELAQNYGALCPRIPDEWEKITWKEAEESLSSI